MWTPESESFYVECVTPRSAIIQWHKAQEQVNSEIQRAVQKHGFLQTPMNPQMLPETRLTVLIEEVGEYAKALTYDNRDLEHAETELIQIAAMAIASVVGMRLARQ